MKKIKIKIKKPWIAYCGSSLQQNYAEDLTHGYLLWDIDNKSKFDVSFHELPNPKPYVTLEWAGSIKNVMARATTYPDGTRFRIKSGLEMTQQEVQELTSLLKQKCNATEVAFKNDNRINHEIISSGKSKIIKTDLRNPDVLAKLVKDYYESISLSDEDWQKVLDQIKTYLASCSIGEEIARNSKWSLRHISFDNTFIFNSGNKINIDNIPGIVGIFGANRIGKSSIVGTMLYSLFNTTDRGPIKNLYVCNIRKPHCYSKAIITVDGVDYIIERQTTKSTSKKGVMNASTVLNLYRVNELGELDDLTGEQRTETEKTIKKLIGTSEDFLLTSIAAQGEINQFISKGSTSRRQTLSRFLDLDIFDRMYDCANKDVNVIKAQLKNTIDRDWLELAKNYKLELTSLASEIDLKSKLIEDKNLVLTQLRHSLAQHNDFTPVTSRDVEIARQKYNDCLIKFEDVNTRLKNNNTLLETTKEKLKSTLSSKEEYDLNDLKKRLEAFNSLEMSVLSLRSDYEKEASLYKQQQRSLKILDDVPCGDSFPTCKFIKDAHSLKGKIDSQKDRVSKTLEKLSIATTSLEELKKENITSKVQKAESLNELCVQLNTKISNIQLEIVKVENLHEQYELSLTSAKTKLADLEKGLQNDENAEVVSIRTKIDEITKELKQLDNDKLMLASQRGRIMSDITKTNDERKMRESLFEKMKVYELIANAFSKKGIPNNIVTSQLPVINAEIAKILHGIVDFTIELEQDTDSDSMEVYINYGDSKRIIELASGMEKTISSMAIRTALINVSSLPKTDMFVIDEGFGTLDDAGVEACNRLLVSLKKYFKTIVVITHVDGIKDVVDHVLELTKVEKDAHVELD